jgi:pantoate--beta-alanine ligase
MQIIYSIKGIRELQKTLKDSVGGPPTMGFVPTMGYLHEGHISLVKQAKAENEVSAVSIFVNPTQFGPKEDFKTYPRDLNRDLKMLEPYTDIVFIPEDKEMYPDGYNTWVEVKDITDVLEGAVRPGHFKGVTTVVAKLFNIVMPDKAYFGQKDAQQVAVIKKMVTDLNMPLEVVVCPTLREKDGLAMSSRNTYLTPEMRQNAPVLYRSLQKARELYRNGEKDAGKIKQVMTAIIESQPIGIIDYISIADNETLREVTKIDRPALISMAVKFGKTRLIDNIVLE